MLISRPIHLINSNGLVFGYRVQFSENGIKAQEQGEVKNKGTDNEIQSVRGSYRYVTTTWIRILLLIDEKILKVVNFVLCVFRYKQLHWARWGFI